MGQYRLAKALKLKNKLAGELAELMIKIQRNNIYTVGKEPDYNAEVLFQQYKDTQARLVKIKVAIQAANQAVEDKILRMAEAKARLSLLAGIAVKEGVEEEVIGGWQLLTDGSRTQQTKRVEYKSYLNRKRLDSEIDQAKAEIETCQEELDAFNAATMVEIDI
jgi:hypothetical protein